MKLNNANGAFVDINRSLALDDKNSYAYRTLGLYYLEKGDYKDALFNLKLSHELDPETHLITEYIKEAEDKFIAAAD
jgi:lipoprotein NlpI